MSTLLYAVGHAAARARLVVVLVWMVVLAVAGGGSAVFGHGTDDTFSIPGSESQDALDYLGHVFPEVSGTSAQLVVVVPPGRRADTGRVRSAVTSAIPGIKRIPQVSTVIDPFDRGVRGAVSADGRAALIVVPLKVALADVSPRTKNALSAAATGLGDTIGQGAVVHAGGDAFSNRVPKLSATEAVGVLVAFAVLLAVFGSLIAAGMPLLTAVWGVGISVALIYAATALIPVSSTAPMLAVMLGLAVGIDYALFILSRHRDQLAHGLEVHESIARATGTAGSAVIFAGLTVVIALLGLAVANIPFLTTMGVAAAVAVAIAVLIAVTLIPALLALAGERLRPGRRRRGPGTGDRATGRPWGRLRRRQAPRGPARAPRRRASLLWVRLVTRVPALTVVLVVAGLAVCAIPAAGLRLALPDSGTEEPGSPARTTYDVVKRHFGPGYNGPLLVTADVITSTDPVGVTNKIAAEIRALDGVASVPLATPDRKGDTGIIQVIPETGPDSPRTDRLVKRLRAMKGHFLKAYGTETAVTGITAVGIDVSAQLGGALLPFGLLVVGLSLVLLTMVFRSLWVPVKATVGYLLSVAAAFGATAFVFQDGHFAGMLHVAHVGSVISFLPIILMGVLFGLAMDYEVFLVTRIREEYVHHGDAHGAIERGFVSASRVVTAAALIMFAVFAAFVPEGSATIKPIAFSLAAGVFFDAFLIRMTLVPAVLALLGERAWGLPVRLDRALPVFDTEGDALARELRLADWPSPGSDEVISARGLRVGDDRDRTVFGDVTLHVAQGTVLAVQGTGPAGKTALLYALAGRVARLDGDLKVLGRVQPQHARYLRTRVALIACRETADAAAEARRAIADGVRLILLDDVDTVVNPVRRDGLRDLIADRSTGPGTGDRAAALVLTCQSLDRLRDILPPGTATVTLPTALVGSP